MTAPRFDAILFDAGGIFVVPDPATIGSVLGPLGGASDPASIVRAHYAALDALERHALAAEAVTLELLDWDLYRSTMAEVCGVPAARVAAAVTGLSSVWSPLMWRHRLDESVSALWRLHRAGVPVGVVSNASGQVEGTLRYQGICQVGPGGGVPVLCVVDSEVVGFTKPDPRIFDQALEVLGMEAGPRIAYVGDSVVNDVGGARAAGLTALLYDPYGDRQDFDTIERLASLHELHSFV